MKLSESAAYILLSLGGIVACWNGFWGLVSVVSVFRTDTKSRISPIPFLGTVGILVGIDLLGWFSAPEWLLWVSGFLLLADSGGPGGLVFWVAMKAVSFLLLKISNRRKF